MQSSSPAANTASQAYRPRLHLLPHRSHAASWCASPAGWSTGYYDQLLSQQVTSIAYRAGKTASLWSTQQKKNSKINIQRFQTSRETHQWPQSLWTPPLPPAPHHHLCERNLSMLKKHIWKKCIWSMTKRENVSLFFITLTQSDALPVGLEPLHFQVFFSCRVMNTSAAHWMLQFMARPEMLMVS